MKTIVIDAGHGGHDVGCLGSSAQEKNIALAVSLKLGALIEKLFPDIRVVYTRETDVFIELHERAAIANRAKADLSLLPGSKITDQAPNRRYHSGFVL